MEAKFVSNGDVPQINGEAARYWVRLWAPPAVDQTAWFVDEWQVSGAPDVLAVVEWAREQAVAGGSFEVFVEHPDHAVRGGSEVVPVTRHIRVYGAPGESDGVTEVVAFTANWIVGGSPEIARPASAAAGLESL